MAANFEAPQERLLATATSAKSLDWQAMSITALFSILLHVFASQDLKYESILERSVAAGISVLPLFFIIGLAHSIPVKSATTKIVIVLSSYLVGGAARGLALSALLDFNGVLVGGGLQSRIASSVISMSITVAIVTYVWTTYKTHSDAISNLVNETEQLRTALAQIELEVNAQSFKQMSDISEEILSELERIQLSPGGEQLETIQRVIDKQVRPMSREFALDVASWVPANVKIPSASFLKTWSSLNPVSNLPSSWFTAAISLSPMPIAYAMFGLSTAITLSLFIFLALTPSVFFGFKLARRVIPKFKSPWREIAFTLMMELIAVPGVLATYLALIHTDDPSVYMVSGLITFPIYSWIVTFGGALFEDLKNKRVALLQVQRQLNWAIARVNLLAWYNRGIISRLLHGPIQNAMHATVIRLRNRDTLTVVDNVINELQQRIAFANSNIGAGVGTVDDLDKSLQEIRSLWNQIADVSISTTEEVLHSLVLDKPAAAIVIDLCSEICSNAIRHGKANDLRIELQINQSEIMVTMVDNGAQPTEGTGLGLGRRFLDNCSINWTTTRFESRNSLTVLLPGRHSPTS